MVERFKRKSSQKGFTLIELVLYMGLLIILMGLMSTIFTSIIDVQLESSATSSVDQDGRYILAKFLHDFQSNNPVVIKQPKDPGTQTNFLQLNINSSLTDTIYSIDNNGNLIITDSSGSAQLNSSDTSIATFSATRIGSGSNKDTVKVTFTLSSRTKERSGYEVKTFQSTFSNN